MRGNICVATELTQLRTHRSRAKGFGLWSLEFALLDFRADRKQQSTQQNMASFEPGERAEDQPEVSRVVEGRGCDGRDDVM